LDYLIAKKPGSCKDGATTAQYHYGDNRDDDDGVVLLRRVGFGRR
jgi:hypothetical protein